MFKVYRKFAGHQRLVFSGTFTDHKWFMFSLLSYYKQVGKVLQVNGDVAYLHVLVNGQEFEYYSHC